MFLTILFSNYYTPHSFHFYHAYYLLTSTVVIKVHEEPPPQYEQPPRAVQAQLPLILEGLGSILEGLGVEDITITVRTRRIHWVRVPLPEELRDENAGRLHPYTRTTGQPEPYGFVFLTIIRENVDEPISEMTKTVQSCLLRVHRELKEHLDKKQIAADQWESTFLELSQANLKESLVKLQNQIWELLATKSLLTAREELEPRMLNRDTLDTYSNGWFTKEALLGDDKKRILPSPFS